MSATKHIRQLGTETLIYGLSGSLARFVQVFLIPVYTRVFTPADYGVNALVAVGIQFLTMFVVLGLNFSAGRWFYDSDRIHQRKTVISSWFWCQFGASILLMIGLFAIAPYLSRVLLGSSEYITIVRLALLTVPLLTFSTVATSWLRFQRRAIATVVYQSTRTLGSIGLIMLFVLLLDKGLTGLWVAQVLVALAVAVIGIAILKSWIAPRFVERHVLREMLIFGMPLIPASVAAWVTSSSDRFIIHMFYDSTEVGLYSLAASVASGIALITSAFQLAWGPFAYSILGEEGALHTYSKVFSIYSWFGAWIGTVIVLFTPALFALLATPAYYPAISSVPYLVFAQIFNGAIYIAAIGPGIAKRSVPVATSTFFAAGANVALNFLLIPSFGRQGAAVSTLISYLVALTYLFYVAQRIYPIDYHFQHMIVSFGLAAAIIASTFFLSTETGFVSLGVRLLLSTLFIPLAFWIKILTGNHVVMATRFLVRQVESRFT